MSGPIANTLLTDEDIDGPVIAIARKQFELQTIRVVDVGLEHAEDLDIFRYAQENGYVIVTGNFKDFPSIFAEWLADGNQHAGVTIVGSKHLKNSLHIAQELVKLAAQDMQNRVEWI